MTYTVVWTPSAEDELAEIWNQAADQQAVADASNRIDRLLRRNPLDLIEPVHEGLFSFVAEPLAILLEVEPDDRLVRVVQVKRI